MAEIEGGYVLLSRRLIESGIWEKPPIYLKVWMYILTRAQHKPYKNLERGELLVSIPELIEACSYKVGYRTEKPTKTQIFNVLEWLRNSDEGADEGVTNGAMIETTKTTRGMIVKVLNYNVYQDPKSYERNAGQNDEEATIGTMPERQADTINKNDKNVKNEKKKTSRKQVYDVDSDYYKLATFMKDEIMKNSPNMKEPNLQKWANDFRLLIEVDKKKVPPAEIKSEVSRLIRWVQQDSFEMAVILSPSSLRRRYDSLVLKMNNDSQPKQKEGRTYVKPKPYRPDSVDLGDEA